MSITDELRAWAKGSTLSSWTAEHLTAIADHIDAEYKKACDDAWDNGYEADYLGIEKWLTEHPQVMEHHGWICLPKDADGEPWHINDEFDIDEGIAHVNGIGDNRLFYIDNDGMQWTRADNKLHYHEPTVEDVLREFSCVLMGKREFDGDVAEAISEYAAKLCLAGEDA